MERLDRVVVLEAEVVEEPDVVEVLSVLASEETLEELLPEPD